MVGWPRDHGNQIGTNRLADGANYPPEGPGLPSPATSRCSSIEYAVLDVSLVPSFNSTTYSP